MLDTTATKALHWGQKILEDEGIVTAHLDAVVLLEDNTGIDRAKLLAEPQMILTESAITRYRQQINERSRHLPLAYIRLKTEFYGYEFKLNRHVLVPRPESENMIEELKQSNTINSTVIDLGTGSGALIISAKNELPHINAYATDISPECIALAKENAKYHRTKVTFFEGSLTRALPKGIWKSKIIILANLPYVPDSWKLDLAVLHEPKIAIFGGSDGLDVYRQLFNELKSTENKPSQVMTESLPMQHSRLISIAKKNGFKLISKNDFICTFA